MKPRARIYLYWYKIIILKKKKKLKRILHALVLQFF